MDNQSHLLLLLEFSVESFPQSLLAGSQVGILHSLLSLFSNHPQFSLTFDPLQLRFPIQSPVSVHCSWPRLVLTLCYSDPLQLVLIETVWVAGLQQLFRHFIHISESLGFIGSFSTFLRFLGLLVPQSRILLISFLNLIGLIHLIRLIHLNFGTQTVSDNFWVVNHQSDEIIGFYQLTIASVSL